MKRSGVAGTYISEEKRARFSRPDVEYAIELLILPPARSLRRQPPKINTDFKSMCAALDRRASNNIDLALEIVTTLASFENPPLQRKEVECENRVLGVERGRKRQNREGNCPSKRIQVVEPMSAGPAIVKSEVACNPGRESPGSSQRCTLCRNASCRNRIQRQQGDSPLYYF